MVSGQCQWINKDSDFEVTDNITISFENNETIAEAVADNGDYIKAETLAKEIIFEADIQNGVIIEFDTIVTKVQIQKV